MCFRPSPVKRNDNDNQITCETCGMPVNEDSSNCPYCGDPIPQKINEDFPKVDQPTRII